MRAARAARAPPPPPADKFAELWQAPADLAARDLFHGPGGADAAPAAGAAYTWLRPIRRATVRASKSEDRTAAPGTSSLVPKRNPRSSRRVCCGRSVITSRRPTTSRTGSSRAGPAAATGRAVSARTRRRRGRRRLVVGRQRIHRHAAVQRLIVANILLNSWDWKTSNNKIYRFKSGASPRSATSCAISAHRSARPNRRSCCGSFPFRRGFGQGSRNDIDDFESQGFIKRVDEDDVEFDFHSDLRLGRRSRAPVDVRWTAELLNRLTDAQWDDAFRAADYSPDVRARFIRKIKAKIAEGLAVS